MEVNILDQINEFITNDNIERAYELVIEHEEFYRNDATFWTLKASLCVKAGLYQTAYNCLEQALELEPDNSDIYYNIAYVCELLEMYSESALMYGKTLKHTDNEDVKAEINAITSSNQAFELIKSVAATNKKRTYIILSSCGWGDILQRMHHISRSLVKLGNHVQYVCPSLSADVSDGSISLDSTVQYVHSEKRIIDGVEVYQPLIAHHNKKRLFNNYTSLVQSLLNSNQNNLEPVVITYLPHHIETVKSLVGDYKLLYECVDDHNDLEYAFWGHKNDAAWEQELMDRADIITTTATSLFLQRTVVENRENIYLSRNAVNEADFFLGESDELPEDLAGIPEPRIVYTGAIFKWFDVELFYSVVKDNPDKSFVVIGFGQEDLLTDKCENLFLLGAKKHKELKRYLKHMQVGIIPFKDDLDIIMNCDPIKQYEYLACGLPVVSTFLPEAIIGKNNSYLANTKEDFKKSLEKALSHQIENEEKSSFLIDNSWNLRASLICQAFYGEQREAQSSRNEAIKELIENGVKQYEHSNLKIVQAMTYVWEDKNEFLSRAETAYRQSPIKFITRVYLYALFINDAKEDFVEVLKTRDFSDEFLRLELERRIIQSKQSKGNALVIKVLMLYVLKQYKKALICKSEIRNNMDRILLESIIYYLHDESSTARDHLGELSEEYIRNSPAAIYLSSPLDAMEQENKTADDKGNEPASTKRNPFISLIVPTRNSAAVVKYALKTCIEQNYENYEIIVSDNSSPGIEDTRQVVDELNSPKIKYYRTSGNYAMNENYEYAYEQASGEYLIILGSDDGLLLHALETLSEVIKELNYPLSLSWDLAAYGWPKVDIPRIRNGLFIPYPTQKGSIKCTYYDESYLSAVLNFEARYSVLPMFYYNSIIKRELAEEAKKVAGRLFTCSAPDVYTGVVFAHLQKKYIHINMPMAVGGSSESSVGISVGNSVYSSKNKNEDNAAFEIKKVKSQNQEYHSVHAPYFAVEESAVVSVASVAQRYFGDSFEVNRENFYKACTRQLYSGENFIAKRAELYDCLRSYGDTKILSWFEKEFVENERFQGYDNPELYPFKPQYGNGGGLALDASEFGVSDVYGAAKLYRKIVGY